MEHLIKSRFTPLRKEGNSHFESRKKKFNPLFSINEYVEDSVIWAISQEYFKENGRDKKTIIRNAIQGKLGEFGVYKYFQSKGYEIPLPDLKIRKKGEWDDGDLFPEGKKIQIKTTKYSYNLLLLRKSDWDLNGNYKYGNNDNPYKEIFLCRLKPCINDILPKDIEYTIDNIIQFLSNVNFKIDIPGFIDIDDLKESISEGKYLKEGDLIGSFPLEDDFYYFQSGDFRDIDEIPRKRK